VMETLSESKRFMALKNGELDYWSLWAQIIHYIQIIPIQSYSVQFNLWLTCLAIGNIMHEYIQSTTIHGINYITNESSFFLTR
jgi:hypothetical protein